MLFMQDAEQGDFRLDNADLRSGRILCRVSDIRPGQRRGYDGRWWEYQANRMIGSLLLPRTLVQTAIAPFLTWTAVTQSPLLVGGRHLAIQNVAEIFQVSTQVAEIRLDEMMPKNLEQFEF